MTKEETVVDIIEQIEANIRDIGDRFKPFEMYASGFEDNEGEETMSEIMHWCDEHNITCEKGTYLNPGSNKLLPIIRILSI